jgi:5-methylcytosine-specific restriction endonuclease McrBC regulatory subunit McrC
MADIKIFTTSEHSFFTDNEKEDIENLNISLSSQNDDPKRLGLSSNFNVGYFIGAQWLTENSTEIVVHPKIPGLDYFRMFIECLHNPRSANEAGKIYSIDFNEAPIALPADSFELTPIIVIHFLTMLKKIVQKGLKRDYIWIEENLQSKVKGKLLLNKQIKRNFLKKRFDRNVCRFQDYSINCIENRILKKTLNFVYHYINTHQKGNKELLDLFYFVHPAFFSVSDDASLDDLKKIKTNTLFKEYNETLKIAEMILRRFSYSLRNADTLKEEKYPPFYIDMSLLFEMYVLTKLDKVYGKDIIYNFEGSRKTELDFLHISEKTVIDTKYKEIYCKKNGWDKENIWQLSGYARDFKVINRLGIDSTQSIPHIDCLIIYPDMENGNDEISPDRIKANTIKQFIQFYKYGIKLPSHQEY